MRDGLIVSVLSVIPRRAVSRALGWLSRTWLGRWSVRAFVWAYGIDLDEAVVPDGGFDSLDAVFTRRLVPGARVVDPAPTAMVSPVDGICTFAGRTHGGTIGLGGGSVAVQRLVPELDCEVDAVVLYLAPRGYHRVHAPLAGTVAAWRELPGTRWPVFPAAHRRVPDLLAQNERAVVAGRGQVRWWAVLVGAFGVGHIERSVEPGRAVHAGDDLGAFRLGSTVVVLVERGATRIEVAAGQRVRMGERIGLVVAATTE